MSASPGHHQHARHEKDRKQQTKRAWYEVSESLKLLWGCSTAELSPAAGRYLPKPSTLFIPSRLLVHFQIGVKSLPLSDCPASLDRTHCLRQVWENASLKNRQVMHMLKFSVFFVTAPQSRFNAPKPLTIASSTLLNHSS